jgi:thioredoxin 1
MGPLLPLILVLIAVAILGLVGLRYAVYALIRWRAASVVIVAKDPLLATLNAEVPALIYFTGASCGPCKTTQSPIIRQLARERGEAVQIITVDIEEQIDTALRWGVLKVPSTIILNRQHDIVARNLGVAMLPLLCQQLDAASAS